MNITATGGAAAEAPHDNVHGHAHGPLYKLVIGAIGIVFGDIGTSPIYAFRETFAGHHTLIPDRLHIYGVLSLIFWSMMIIVTLKYVTIIMRADNKGEGGSLALLALINRTLSGKKRWTSGIVMLGVFATALFYGDSMITPAISVLSAVEGLTTVNAGLEPFVIPIAIGIATRQSDAKNCASGGAIKIAVHAQNNARVRVDARGGAGEMRQGGQHTRRGHFEDGAREAIGAEPGGAIEVAVTVDGKRT